MTKLSSSASTSKKGFLQLGIFFIIMSAVGFAFQNFYIKELGDVSIWQKIFARNLVSIFVAVCMVIGSKSSMKVPKKEVKFLFLRCLFGYLGIISNFYAAARMPQGDASAIAKTASFLAIFFSFLFMKEKFTKVHVLIMIAVVGASALLTSGGLTTNNILPYLVQCLHAIFAGMAYTMVAKLRGKLPVPVIVLYFSLFTSVLVFPLMIREYTPLSECFVPLLKLSIAATVGQFSVTCAYRFAAARQISVYSYLQIVVAAILGWIFYSEVPTGKSMVAYVIIIAMAIVLYVYEKRQLEKQAVVENG